jgi:hypothetical protein
MRHTLLALAAVLPLAALAGPPAPAASPQPAAQPAQQAPPDPAAAELVALRALAAVSAGEPDVEALQRAAARVADRAHAGAADHGERARWAALLPRLTAEYRHEDQSNRVVGLQSSGEVDYLRLAPSEVFLVRATWDLPTLVAAPGELGAGTQAQVRSRRREEAVDRVTVLFFERRQKRLALLLEPPSDPLARAQAETEVARLGSEIDALTGGALGGRR